MASFERDGFLLLEDVFSAADCQRLIDAANQILDAQSASDVVSVFATDGEESDAYFMESGDKVRVFYERSVVNPDGAPTRPARSCANMIGHALHDQVPVFDCFSRSQVFARIAADIGILDPMLVQSMFIFKQPFIGGSIGLHQDSTYLYTDPPSVVGFWCALEDAFADNGCVVVVPGGHRRELRQRYRRGTDGRFGFQQLSATTIDTMRETPIEAPQGSLLLLHGLLPHRSGPNRTPRSRHAYTLHVADGRFTYPADNWLQRGPDLPFRGFGPRYPVAAPS
ncbi:MAG: phytanoyl-CoA dioxygenase family protein [Micromonosporaceae bacterium]